MNHQTSPIKIILDTNFLLIPGEFKVDIFEEFNRICTFPYELYTVEKTKDELDAIIQKQTRKAQEAARVGKSLLEVKNIKTLSMLGCDTVDEALFRWGEKGAIIATQDKDLKRMLKSLRVQHIVLREKSHLILQG